MALNPALLGTQIATAIAADPACSAPPSAALTAFSNAIATAVVAHLLANAVVSPNGTMLAPPGTGGGPITGPGKIL